MPAEPTQIGPYRVLEEIGAGGMAVVYKAIQPALERLVAIKVLRPEYVHDRQIATRFEREASALATLQHGNIVQVYDFVREPDRAYIVMEYVEGVDLFDILAETRRIPPDVAALIAHGIAEGLEHAHHRGIVHRDIKPSNILVSKKGEIKIMDFGIARDPGKSGLTQVGLAVGTPAYMAPEQIRGDRIDARTDLFALGIVVYEMLSGEKPWTEEEGRSITIKVLDEPMRPLADVASDLPLELVTLAERCLEKHPDDRYSTTHQVTGAIDKYIQNNITLDPRTRLLLFLKNRKLITNQEAETGVQTDLLAEASVRRRDAGIPLPPAFLLLQPVAWAHIAVLTLMLVGVYLTWSPSNAPETSVQVLAPTEAIDPRDPVAAAQSSIGYIRVVADPWAVVTVDGREVGHTPIAEPIRVTATAEHRIGFRNPKFEGEDVVVTVRPGEVRKVKIKLTRKQK